MSRGRGMILIMINMINKAWFHNHCYDQLILITCPYERGEGSPRDRGGKVRGGSHPGPENALCQYLYSIFSVFDCGCGFISVKNLHVCVPRPHQKFCVWWNFDQNMQSRCLLARVQFNWHTSLVAFKRDCLLFLSLQTTAIWWRGRRRLRRIVKTFTTHELCQRSANMYSWVGRCGLCSAVSSIFTSNLDECQREELELVVSYCGRATKLWL